MAHYLIQASYTGGAISDLVKNPQNRADAIRPVIEKQVGDWKPSTLPLATTI